MSDTKEKQDKINNIVRGLAYSVFYRKGDFKFVGAYNKLYAKVYLDHNLHINNRLKESAIKKPRLFDVITSEDDIDKVLESAIALVKFYEDVEMRKAS